MTRNLDEGSEPKWIFSVWVPQIGSIREKEIKKKEHDTTQVQNRKDGKERMHEECMNM